MKLTKIVLAGLAGLAFSSCNLDFSNKCENVWLVTNKSAQAVTVSFDDKTETIAAGAVENPVNQKYDAEIKIADSFRVNYRSSYSYSSSTSKRTLLISDKTRYNYNIKNSLTENLVFKIAKDSATTSESGVDSEDKKTTTYTIAAGANANFTFYDSEASFSFYKSKIEEKNFIKSWTKEQHADGIYYIDIK